MGTKNQYYPDIVFHPAVTLNEKLEEMGMSRKEFAVRTGKPEKTIIAVLKEESSLTPEMAILFENVTQIPASFWINKQARYNEYIARQKQSLAIENALDWARAFPYAAMAKCGWVEVTRKAEEKAERLFNFFGIASHDAWDRLYMQQDLKVAAYTSLKFTHEPYAVSAWLRQGELQAKTHQVSEFDVKKLKNLIPEMRGLMVEQPVDFFQKLQGLCEQAGVILLFTSPMPKAPLSGSTRWIKNTPLVQMTARYKQNDRFWFTFFHELGHIILHGKKYISLENIDFEAADQKKEEEANRFAAEICFSEKQEREMLQLFHLSEKDILDFARKFNTHPAMIVGRLQKIQRLPYTFGRKFFHTIDLC